MTKLGHDPTELEIEVADDLTRHISGMAEHMQYANENCHQVNIMVLVYDKLRRRLADIGYDPYED